MHILPGYAGSSGCGPKEETELELEKPIPAALSGRFRPLREVLQTDSTGPEKGTVGPTQDTTVALLV